MRPTVSGLMSPPLVLLALLARHALGSCAYPDRHVDGLWHFRIPKQNLLSMNTRGRWTWRRAREP